MIKSNLLRVLIFTFLSILFSTLCIAANTKQNSAEFILQDNIAENEVSITYVGNAGFLIRIGDKKILIDALFKGFEGTYVMPLHIQEKLVLAEAPFDNVDLIMVTHAHGDHIDVDMVRQHMNNNIKGTFVSTEQMVNAFTDFPERSIGFSPEKGRSEIKEINGIRIESFYLPHGPDSRIRNIGFLVSVNGITFFQTGDVDFDQFTFDEFRALQLPEKKIDLSFIQHFYLTNDSTSKKFVQEGIAGKYIIPIHYHFTTPAYDSSLVKQNYPDAIIFGEEMESWSMPDQENEFSEVKGDCLGQIYKDQTYDELREIAIGYFPNKADSTILIMEYAFLNFPDEFLNSSTILTQVYTRVGEFPKAIELWEVGIKKGYAYGLNNRVYLEYFKDNADFERLVKAEGELLETLHLKHEVVLPAGYKTKKSYPILYIFHGNSRNIEKSKLNWKAPVLDEEFITVFIQSYMPASEEDFRWVSNDDKTKNEFQEIYDQIIKDYSVDDSKIVFAGMSAGGRIAVEFAMNNFFPVSGLVLNCPVIPPDITEEMIIGFAERNSKIGIISGENDFALENQKNLVNSIENQSGLARITVNNGVGHTFAENFSLLLDEFLRWVIK